MIAEKPRIDEEVKARQSLWGSFISELEDQWDDEGGETRNSSGAPAILPCEGTDFGFGPSGVASTWARCRAAEEATPNLNETEQSSLPFPRWSGGNGFLVADRRVGATDQFQVSLRQWMASHCGDGPMDIAEKREYLQKSVHVLRSLAGNIVGGLKGKGDGGDEIVVHPNFISVSNVVVQERKTAMMMLKDNEKLSAYFVRDDSICFKESGEDETRKMYLAMDALGRMAYEMIMPGDGPSVREFCLPGMPNTTAASVSNALSIHCHAETDTEEIDEENEIVDMLRKNPRMTTSEEKDGRGLISTMLNAGVPFPMCRFVSDLLDDGTMFRSDHSFSSFGDVLSDLRQMMDNPCAFLHASSPDQWKLVFGEKLYGRDDDTKAFMDAAERVACIRDDPIFDSLANLKGKRREVVMVSGHSGAGKSRLVRSGAALLEKRGWRFLRCKFDRVVHPEPLSILAYAFDEYFGSFAGCPKHGMKHADDNSTTSTSVECCCSGGSQEICHRLKSIINLEGLGILAKHIPLLQLVLDVQLPSSSVEVSETMMASLFGKLLQALTSKRAPLLFFIDDLQWADALSLALLTALIKGAGTDSLHLSATDKVQRSQVVSEDDTSVMFVGSFRDNEVDDDHSLTKVLHELASDTTVNVTNIALTRFTLRTLNGMLSESLCMPIRRVSSLSKLVIQKTDGQPLHVIEFIQALTMDNLLTHSFARGWEWDADSIDICPITDSVAELFTYKLRRLPKDVLPGLQILSCFGSQIDQHVLALVADYDGASSVDIPAAIDVALSKGLVERAAQLVSFSHDMIQKATIDSINEDDLVPLLRKLSAALIKNASAEGKLNSVLFVVVDLINRVGSDATPCPKERILFANLNLRAGLKSISVPDFTAAAKYAEVGIGFLRDDNWETQYDLSLSLFETSVLSQFSSREGNQDQLMKRINAVFEHAKDFPDQFKTHCVWIELLSMTDVSRANEESLNALERLGEPLDLANVDFNMVRNELTKLKEQFFGERKKKLLSTNRLADCNKVRAMKVMSSLTINYHQQNSILAAYLPCQMIKMTMTHGHCEHSVFGATAFAAALVNILADIDEASAWGHSALSLMNMYDKNALMPSIYCALYGMVFIWKEPFQSQLEPLAEAIRASFAKGHVEFSYINTIYYLSRSFFSGKNIRVLLGEVEALARQHGNQFGNAACSDEPVYSPLLQYILTPLYNALHDLEDKQTLEEDYVSFPLEKVQLLINDDIMHMAIETKRYGPLHLIVAIQTVKAFMLRDMESALRYTNLYMEYFMTKEMQLNYSSIWNTFYEALITFHFMRQTGKEHYLVRAENALLKMKGWLRHSDWNFQNKILLVKAEFYNTQKDFDKAALYYEASIKSAQEHKFDPDEAIANELAGIFFLEKKNYLKSHVHFARSIECYKKWGATAAARRVQDEIRNNFDLELLDIPVTVTPPPLVASKGSASKKRQLNE